MLEDRHFESSAELTFPDFETACAWDMVEQPGFA